MASKSLKWHAGAPWRASQEGHLERRALGGGAGLRGGGLGGAQRGLGLGRGAWATWATWAMRDGHVVVVVKTNGTMLR